MSELLAWFKTRVLSPRIFGLALLPGLAAIGASVAMNGQPPTIIGALLLGGLLVISFRLWDDLEDRIVDQIRAPSRLLVTTNKLALFWCALVCALMMVAVMLVVLNGPARLVPLLTLVALMAALYRYLPAMTPRRVLRDRLVLLKYPTFVYLLSSEGFVPAVVVAGSIVLFVVAAFDAIDQSKRML